jgi:endonuclease/exonuclease/phosphatase (EEP) superfamily protein YafD
MRRRHRGRWPLAKIAGVVARGGLVALGTLLVAATALPLLRSSHRLIRIWDFPRLQTAALLVLVLALSPGLLGLRRRPQRAFSLALLVALAYQIARILPYTPLHPRQVRDSENCRPEDSLRILIANVLRHNRRAEALLELVREVQPDLILLLETDAWWEGELAVLHADYPHRVSRPQDDTYGIHLASRLPLVGPRVRFLLEDYVPSIRTGVVLRSGAQVDFHGVHPKPPPLDHTARRDAELLIVGREVRAEGRPAIVAGDLNDVAWSATTELFQQISGLLDPRIGRGLYPTYNAEWPLLRWPLDHVFFERSFTLSSMRCLPDIGSDHFPLFIELCHRPQAAPVQPRPEPEPEDLEDAAEAIRKGQEEAPEPDR